MIIKISVTQDDIAEGHAHDGCYCPIARAVLRAMPWLPDLIIGNEHLFADAEDTEGVAELPAVAVEFIGRFDRYWSVEPFEFDLDVPDHLVPAGATS